MEQADLINGILELSKRVWDNHHVPLLLSNLPQQIVQVVPEYKALLGGKTLKKFIQETSGASGYKLVEHPVHKAKLAVLPQDVDYHFPEMSEVDSIPKKGADSSEKIIIAFLRRLAVLSPEDVDKINIPTSILVKLLR